MEFLPYLWGIETNTILNVDYIPNFLFSYCVLFILFNIIIFFTNKFNWILIYWLNILSIILILLYINIQKILRLREPISLNDLFLFKEAIFVIKQLHISYFIPILILLLIILILELTLTKYFKYRINQNISLLIKFFLLVFTLIFGINARNNIFGKNVFWGNYFNYIENGFFIYLTNNIFNYKVEKPANYNEENIKFIAEKLKRDFNFSKRHSNIKPNIILILNESFWDITQLPKIRSALKRDVLSFVHSNNIFKFKFYVPYFSLGTANTEFEVLTGLSMNFFNFLVTPYLQYINDYTYSLPNVLKENDYYTWSIHANTYWFYNRYRVYDYLGFDKFYSLETIPFKVNFRDKYIPYDKEVYDFIIKKIKDTPRRDFVFFITLQNHYPYDFKIHSEKLKIKNLNLPDFSKEENIEILNYINLLVTTDNDIKNLYQSIHNLDEPTLVIIFGDHLPPFTNEIYEKLGVFKNEEEYLHITPLLVFSNYKLDSNIINELNSSKYIKSNHLMYFVLRLVNLENIYSDFINKIYKNYYITIDDYKLVQYDILFGKKYFYKHLNFKPINNKNYEIGDNLYIHQIGDKIISENYKLLIIQGENFTPYTNVYVDNQEKELESFYYNSNYILALTDKNISPKLITLKITDLENKNNILKIIQTNSSKITNNLNNCFKIYKKKILKYNYTIYDEKNIILEIEEIPKKNNDFFIISNQYILKRIYASDMDDFIKNLKKYELENSYFINQNKIYIQIPALNIKKENSLEKFLKKNPYEFLFVENYCK
jgi:phosphoglycerol transferase MdoB-like AlkP superfamily enzyme